MVADREEIRAKGIPRGPRGSEQPWERGLDVDELAVSLAC